MNTDPGALGYRVAAIRLRLRMSLRDAAAEAGVHMSTISRLENGLPPSWAAGLKLTAWCDEKEPDARELTHCKHPHAACLKCGALIRL